MQCSLLLAVTRLLLRVFFAFDRHGVSHAWLIIRGAADSTDAMLGFGRDQSSVARANKGAEHGGNCGGGGHRDTVPASDLSRDDCRLGP